MTIVENNPCTQASVRDCMQEQPAYMYKIFSKRRKIYKAFKHYGKHEPGQDTTHKLKEKFGQG